MKRDNTKSVTAAVLIAAPPERVWSVWSRFGNVQDYVATVPRSYLTGECESGLGTTPPLIGLKHHIESGELVTPTVLKRVRSRDPIGRQEDYDHRVGPRG